MSRKQLQQYLERLRINYGITVHISTVYRWRKLPPKGQFEHWQQEVLRLYMSPNKPSISAVAERVSKEYGVGYYRVYRFIKRYTQEYYDVVVLAREGERQLKQKALFYIQRDHSKINPGEFWVADGHRFNLWVQSGRGVFRPLLVCFQDFATKRIVGWEVGFTERHDVIAAALFNAVVQTQLPVAVYFDNGKAFQSIVVDEVLGELEIKKITALPYNPQSKTVERFFRHLDDHFSRTWGAYTGTNALDKPADYHRSEIFLRKLDMSRSAVPFSVFYEELRKWIEEYNSRCPGIPRSQIVAEPIKLLPSTYRTLQRNGFRFNGEYYFSEALYGLEIGKKYRIRYSYYFSDRIFVELRDKYYCTAYRVEKVHPAASVLGDREEQVRFQAAIKLKRQLQKQTQQKLLEIFGLDAAKLEATKRHVDEDEKKPRHSRRGNSIALWWSDKLNNNGEEQ